jgi:hypothetical protein
MMLKFTQFAQTSATRSMVCLRCGYQMFWTKRFNWQCGPGCDGAHAMLDPAFQKNGSGVRDRQ